MQLEENKNTLYNYEKKESTYVHCSPKIVPFRPSLHYSHLCKCVGKETKSKTEEDYGLKRTHSWTNNQSTKMNYENVPFPQQEYSL